MTEHWKTIADFEAYETTDIAKKMFSDTHRTVQ